MTREQAYEATHAAYMRGDYGDKAWPRMFAFLLKQGHSPAAAAAILLSKHPRWADDSQGRGDGKGTNSAAFARSCRAIGPHLYRVGRTGAREAISWIDEGKDLAEQTFGMEEAHPILPVLSLQLVALCPHCGEQGEYLRTSDGQFDNGYQQGLGAYVLPCSECGKRFAVTAADCNDLQHTALVLLGEDRDDPDSDTLYVATEDPHGTK